VGECRRGGLGPRGPPHRQSAHPQGGRCAGCTCTTGASRQAARVQPGHMAWVEAAEAAPCALRLSAAPVPPRRVAAVGRAAAALAAALGEWDERLAGGRGGDGGGGGGRAWGTEQQRLGDSVAQEAAAPPCHRIMHALPGSGQQQAAMDGRATLLFAALTRCRSAGPDAGRRGRRPWVSAAGHRRRGGQDRRARLRLALVVPRVDPCAAESLGAAPAVDGRVLSKGAAPAPAHAPRQDAGEARACGARRAGRWGFDINYES
jgi:hypothetical protein